MNYMEPARNRLAFTCPHCSALAGMRSIDLFVNTGGGHFQMEPLWGWRSCAACGGDVMWRYDELAYPSIETGPPPNDDLLESVRQEYDEARDVGQKSPRAAAALLRLALDKLTAELDGGKYAKLDINKRIGAMVRDGLHPSVQQMLDSVRVFGNNAVHPGQLDLNADATLIDSLFWLLNEICDEMISKPKQQAAIYAALPQSSLDQIAKRDGTITPTT